MSTADYLVRAMNRGGTLRMLAVRTTMLAGELLSIHGCLPTGGAALARVATAGLLLGGTIKGREQVGIQIKGDGPLGELLAVADARGHVRATVDHPGVALERRDDGKFDIARAIGPGQLVVTKSLGLKEPYRSVVPLVKGEIATDLAYYFTVSEQKPAAMGLGERLGDDRLVQAAGGFLIQAFPNAEDEELERVEEAIGQLPPLSEMLAEGLAPEAILQRIVPSTLEIARYPVARTCTCSRDRFERTLVALGSAELEQLIEEDEQTELVCHFCRRAETFSRDELRELLVQASYRVH